MAPERKRKNTGVVVQPLTPEEEAANKAQGDANRKALNDKGITDEEIAIYEAEHKRDFDAGRNDEDFFAQRERLIASAQGGRKAQIQAAEAQIGSQEAQRLQGQTRQAGGVVSAEDQITGIRTQKNLDEISSYSPNAQPTTGGQLTPPNPINVGAGVAGGLGTAGGAALVGGAAVSFPVAAVGTVLATGALLVGEERQKVKEFSTITKKAPNNFNAIIEGVNKGLYDRQTAMRMWATEKDKIYTNQANIKAQTENELTKFLSDPGEELIAIDDFVTNQLPLLDLDLATSLAAPDPNRQFTYTQVEEETGGLLSNFI